MGGDNGRTLEIVTGPLGGNSAAQLTTINTLIASLYKHMLKSTLDPAKCVAVTGKPDLCFHSLKSILAGVPGLQTSEGCNSHDAHYYGPGGAAENDWQALRETKQSPRTETAGIVMSKTDRTPTGGRGGPQMTMGVPIGELNALTPDSLFQLSEAGNRTYPRGTATHYVPGKAARVALWNNTKAYVASIPNPAYDRGLDDVYRAYLSYVVYAVASHVRNHFDVDLWNDGDGYGDPSFKNAYLLYPKTKLTGVLAQLTDLADDGVALPSADAVLTATGACGPLATIAPRKTTMGNSYQWVTDMNGDRQYATISAMTCKQLFEYYWANVDEMWQHKPASVRADDPRVLFEIRLLEKSPMAIKMPATLDKVDADTSFTIATPALPRK